MRYPRRNSDVHRREHLYTRSIGRYISSRMHEERPLCRDLFASDDRWRVARQCVATYAFKSLVSWSVSKWSYSSGLDRFFWKRRAGQIQQSNQQDWSCCSSWSRSCAHFRWQSDQCRTTHQRWIRARVVDDWNGRQSVDHRISKWESRRSVRQRRNPG